LRQSNELGDMSKARINQKTKARCLLTEIAPYETPTLFSNWGSYNYIRSIKNTPHPAYLKKLFSSKGTSVPFKYRIKKDGLSTRTLALVHPNNSEKIVEFYRKYDIAIIRACKRSQFSLRAPHHIAKFFTHGKGFKNEDKEVEDITAETAYASSYFAYSRFSHLHKFFDSDEYTELEKRFSQMRHLDIAKFFPSLYTHSVSWAVRGKTRTKNQRFGNDGQNNKIAREAFDAAFDDLLQQLNYKETHGIPIGPELCRIFSEVILQKIDSTVIVKLKEHGLNLGKEYWCYRYIDDFYVFFNDQAHFARFYKCLSEELEKFKLYLNDDKHHAATRPFISPLSIRKLEISSFLNELFDRRSKLDSRKSSSEINKLRALIKDDEVLFSGVSAFLLSSLFKQMRGLYKPPQNDSGQTKLFDALYVYLDLAFHAFQMDIRVATSFKITAIILQVTKNLNRLPLSDQAKLMDKIVFEMRSAFESALFQGSSVECMNLLIANAIFADKFPLTPTLIEDCIKRLRDQHDDEYSVRNQKRMAYFEIVTLIYYFRENKAYQKLKALLLSEAKQAISDFNPCEYAETAHLLLDLTSCPFLEKAEKDELIDAAMRQELQQNQKLTPADIAYFRNFVSKHSWYFNWTPNAPAALKVVPESEDDGVNPNYDLERHEMLHTHLLKKQLLLAY
jgi:hypothetical protein